MATNSTPDGLEARELSLIGKVELRIALANSDTKLESLLQTYLAPLLLKLASESINVRNKVISICQHINKRIQAPSIKLPVAALLKQFKDQPAPLVRHFDLLYAQQGITRLPAGERVDLLPLLIDGISKDGESANGASIFNLILRLLPLLELSRQGAREDGGLRTKFLPHLEDAKFLSFWFEKVLLFTNAEYPPGISVSDKAFLKMEGKTDTWDSNAQGGLNLIKTKVAVAHFLSSGAFLDSERFLPALFASADSNSRLSNAGDDMLKHFEIATFMEDQIVVERLFELYFGNMDTLGPEGAPPVRPMLQTKILSYLSRSKSATAFIDKIIKLLDQVFTTGAHTNAAESTRVVSAQGLEATKLRGQIFSFISWVARMGVSSDLQTVAQKAVTGLREFIEAQGWPSPNITGQRLSPAELNLRSQAYSSIGLLVPKIGEAAIAEREVDLDLVRWLFTSLGSDSSGDEIFVSIEQAIGSVLNTLLQRMNVDLQKNLAPLLLHHMNTAPGEDDLTTGYKTVRSTRFAALRFANRCLPFKNIDARWIDILAVGGGQPERQEVVEEGRKGLDPYWHKMLNPSKSGTWDSSQSMHDQEDPQYAPPTFQDVIEYLFDGQETMVSGKFSGSFSLAFAPAVIFARNVLLWEAMSSSNMAIAFEPDWEARLDAGLTNKEESRSAVRNYLVTNEASVSHLLRASLIGLLWNDGQGLGQCGVHFIELCSLSSNALVSGLANHLNATRLSETILSNNSENRAVAAHAFGLLASHPDIDKEALHGLLDHLMKRVLLWREAVGQALNHTHGSILAMSYYLSRLSFRQQKVPEDLLVQFVGVLLDILVDSRDALLQASVQTAIGELSLASVFRPSILPDNNASRTAVEHLIRQAKKEKESAVSALGRFALVFRRSEVEGETSTSGDIVESLYDLHEVRRPEIQFAVGQALSVASVGWGSTSLVTAFDVDGRPPEQDVGRSSKVLADVVDKVLQDCRASKPTLKKASAIWLLSLVQCCGHFDAVQKRLRKCQAAFGDLLADRDEVVQETGSRGLSLVYEMGDKELKDDLVHDLVRSFTGTNANMGGTVTSETELFDAGALPTGEGRSVTTYKDIMSLASEVGDPSLVYRFMSLASNNAIWSSRAAFGRFGLSNVLSDSSVNGYLAQNPKLYPKLYRYRFDPNPNVQRSMNDIWNALVKDSNAVIDTCFNAIMDDLLKSILGKEWRVRQASCAAIADLVQGRQIEKYEKYLDSIWSVSFKVLDDIKETVRAAAMRLCKVLTNLLILSLEVGDADSKRSQTLLEHALPFLLSPAGLESSAQEVQAYSISTLLQIIKKSPSKGIRNFAPQIFEKLLGSLSSLEPQAVNYVHLNADKYGMTGQEIDNMRLSSMRVSPVMEAIERTVESLDEASMKPTSNKLEDVLRSAVGLPSKVGCSRVLVALSTRQNILFRPYADRFVQLLRKSVLDRNDTVSTSYSTALGYLMRLATDKQVLQTIEFSKSLYFSSDEQSHRTISGEILYSMSKLSSDRFTTFAQVLLPFVFVAKHDAEEQTKELFDKTWKDNVGGSRAVTLYLQEILELVSSHLDSPRWVVKHTSAVAVADIVSSFDGVIDVQRAESIWPVLERAMAGKTWEGKEVVLNAFVKFVERAKGLWLGRRAVSDEMKASKPLRQDHFFKPHNNHHGQMSGY